MDGAGWITIETDLGTKKFDKKYEQLKTRLENEKIKLDIKEGNLKNAKRELEETTKELTKIKEKRDEINNTISKKQSQYDTLNSRISSGEALTSDEYLRFASLDNTLSNLRSKQAEINAEYDKYNSKLEKSYDLLAKTESQYNIQKNKVKLLQGEFQQLNDEINKIDLSKMQKSIDNVGNSVSKTIKKVGKWALAVFGVRSAYMFVRQAMSTLSQYDDQMATNVEYIRYLLANTLKPVIETLIQLVYKLLTYIGYIAKAWFGVDLFANASAEAFNKNKNALAGASKNAKELQKTLAGFDEMNVLQENGSTASGGGGGGVSLPSFPSMENTKIPSWVQWIVDNGDLVAGIIGGITGALIAMKLFGLDPILSLGIGIIIMGIILLIQDIIKFIKDPSWDNFAEILKDLAILLMGVVVVMIALNAVNPTTWIILAIALIAALVALIIQNWDKIKDVLGKVGNWINEHIIKPVADFFVGLWNGIVNGFNSAIEWIKTTFNSVVNFFKNIINTIVSLFRNIGTKVGNVIGSAFKGVINDVLSAIENILNFPIRSINSLIGVINAIPGINLGKLTTFKLPRLAKGGIINMPGRGVPVGGAIGGERGQEAVLPLTDSQQMDLLGASIAKHMSVNATIPVYVGNRQVAREIRKINAEEDFAFNG